MCVPSREVHVHRKCFTLHYAVPGDFTLWCYLPFFLLQPAPSVTNILLYIIIVQFGALAKRNPLWRYTHFWIRATESLIEERNIHASGLRLTIIFTVDFSHHLFSWWAVFLYIITSAAQCFLEDQHDIFKWLDLSTTQRCPVRLYSLKNDSNWCIGYNNNN